MDATCERAIFRHASGGTRRFVVALWQEPPSVEVVPKTDIIAVQFRANDPTLAAEVVNSTVARYTERNFRSSFSSATLVSNWLSRQMDDLRTKASESTGEIGQPSEGKKGVFGSRGLTTLSLKNSSRWTSS